LTLGGAYGFFEGLRSSPSPAFKIRLNTVLNGMTRRGPFIGNSAGVLAGLRAAGSAGGVCAVAAGIWAFGKEALNL
ncbi:Mitochondrial import inner membrane translocase subunit tim23, partial [Linnemannia elongata]